MVDIVMSIAAKVAEYLVDPITLQLSYVFNYRHHVKVLLQQVENLGHAREKVEILVEEAIRQGHEIFPQVQYWLQATQQILQTREDFVQDDERASKGCLHLKSRYILSKKVMKQREDIEAKLKQTPDTVSYRPPPPPLISSVSSTNDGAFPSRQSIFNQIMEALRNEQTSIVGVWGMGGVGKTTLALQIAKRAEKEKLFDKVVMASSISKNPNISEIQAEMARTLGLRFEADERRSVDLMNSLKKQKKILVIIDDIWDKLDLRKIGIPNEDDHKGCKLLMTSREYEVVATDMKAQKVFYLQHLKAEEAWSLFKSTVGDSVESPDLKAVADEIVKKCEGLPIAIITVANALKNKNVGEWKNALKELKRAKPINVRRMTDNVYSCLELSYNHLEGDEAKSLFLLCGLVGGRRISKDHLLLYATGLNMLEGMYSMEDATNKLITLVEKLRASSLLLSIEEGDNDGKRSLFFDELFVKMHDVVRDVARSIASKDPYRQYVVSEAVELRNWERGGECRNYRGISLECGDQRDELPPRITVCPELELFLLNSSPDPSQWSERPGLRIPDDFFQGLAKLRVLQMTEVSLRPTPLSLGFLGNLRTLCLIRCELHDFKVIGEMRRLQVLSLEGCDIVELPKEIGQLKDLRVLDLHDCERLSLIPQSVISSLSGLECLCVKECNGIEWERDGESNSNRACLSEINDLPSLRTLEVSVSDPSLIPEDIGLHLVNLTRYSILIGRPLFLFEEFSRQYSRELTTCGVSVVLLKRFSNLFNGCQLLKLEHVHDMSNVVYDLANENGFPQLEHLRINESRTVRHIVSSSQKWVPPHDTFCRLDQLFLYQLRVLESVFDIHESAPILVECFGKLRLLSMSACNKLRCIMSLPMQHGTEINFFPRLQKLELDFLPSLSSFYSTATPELSEVPVSTLFGHQAAFPALKELIVSWLEDHVRALWDNQFPVDSFSKLRKLEVEYCNGLQKFFPISLVNAFVQLEALKIRWCESLAEIIVNEGGNGDNEDEAAFFPKLTDLHLKNLDLLKRFCSPAIKLRWPLLKTLTVKGCAEVGILFEEVGLEGKVILAPLFSIEKEAFPDLERLEIVKLDGVMEIWAGQFSRMSFSKLRVLRIRHCDGIPIVISSTMIQNLHNLEELMVDNCASMKEVIQPLDDEHEIQFSKLKCLQLCGLSNLTGFCSATCTFRFPSLERLELSQCPKMEFFCKGVFYITNNSLKEYILQVLGHNAKAIHETSTGHSDSNFAPLLEKWTHTLLGQIEHTQ